jgi:hypothetical protein
MDNSLAEHYKQIAHSEKKLVKELETFKGLTNKNIKFLFDQFFRVNNRYNKDVISSKI